MNLTFLRRPGTVLTMPVLPMILAQPTWAEAPLFCFWYRSGQRGTIHVPEHAGLHAVFETCAMPNAMTDYYLPSALNPLSIDR